MELQVEARTDGTGCSARRILTVGAWEFSVWEEDGDAEPRIRDTDAAVRLGYPRVRKVRDLIKRIWPENKGGGERPTAGRSPSPHRRAVTIQAQTPTGGACTRTVREYWLTEAELLKLCARAETPIAEAILDDMIRVYMAIRRHLLQAVPVRAHERRPPGTATPAVPPPVAAPPPPPARPEPRALPAPQPPSPDGGPATKERLTLELPRITVQTLRAMDGQDASRAAAGILRHWCGLMLWSQPDLAPRIPD